MSDFELRDLDKIADKAEWQAYDQAVRARLSEINATFSGKALPEAERSEFAELQRHQVRTEKTIRELEAREAYIAALAEKPTNREVADVFASKEARGSRRDSDLYDLSTMRSSFADPEGSAREIRDRALAAVERAIFPHPRAKQDDNREHLTRLLETSNAPSELARHLMVTGSPVYARAFGKHIMGLPLAADEAAAFRAAMTLGSDTAGGAVVPFQLDPTLILSSDGAINPIRGLARVERITGKEWQAVTTAGATAAYSAEGAEVGDNSPTLVQPSVPTWKAHAFVPFSIELGLAWGSIQADLARVLQDAKDVLEADKFINGTGTTEPEGVVQELAATSIIWTQATGNFGVEDVYALETDPSGGNPLPPRFRPRSAILANLAIINRIRQFATANNYHAYLVDLGAGRPSQLLGRPLYEASEMDATVADGNDIMLQGDFAQYVIIDRIGMSLEFIPHLFHTGNNRPSGQRGVYAHWHNGAEVLVDNAFRKLRVGEGS